ncbi:LLM class flavin-dependent oxidoreductase [Candidatus Poriferisocius sp.]|uniref:LLM class flavin-dependent oxidoreductase n=1 Tax=Candidatus Poriferisocius sp. TaxID=3101276 RepID=UPI003B01C38D
MEFGYFAQCFVPDFGYEDNPDWEAQRIRDNLEISQLCDRNGFKYIWASEHHFLREYSHMSAPEVFLSAVASTTENIHLGSAIFNITAPVNHPVRSAERAAMIDVLSNGRFELGTGRGSSSTEVMGFGMPGAPRDPATGLADTEITRGLWDESIAQIPHMWREGAYRYEGDSFSMPPREIFPKPVTKPHPPLWVACGSPSTFEKAGKLGIGVLCFTIGTPDEIAPLIEIYKNEIASCKNPVGDYVHDNVMCVGFGICLDDREMAIDLSTRSHMYYYQCLVYRWLDTFPKPEGIPEWPAVIPEPTHDDVKMAIDGGSLCVGNAEDCIHVSRQYERVGADQYVISPLTSTLPMDVVRETIANFGKHVIPVFDTDPVHRSTRQREAAMAAAEG